MSLYFWFAETFGWTPSQVGELTLDEIYWLPLIKSAHGDAEEQYRDSNN